MQNGHLDVCQLILENIKVENHHIWTFLSCAIKYGYLELFQKILAKFQEKNPSDYYSDLTPLHCAAEHNQPEIYKLFVKMAQEKCPKDVNGTIILFCLVIFLNQPKKFEFSASLSIEVYALNLFWFVSNLV